jgi:hypothetical protein
MRKIGFPARNEVLEGEPFELVASDKLGAATGDREILDDDA